MKKLLLILCVLLSINKVFSQDCNLSETAQKYWARANAAMESIKVDEDYQYVVDELEKALEYAPICADIYYNLGLAYSKLGEVKGVSFLDKSVNYFQKYLQFSPSADDKKFVQDQIYGIEFKKEKYLNDEALKKKQEEESRKYDFIGIWITKPTSNSEYSSCKGKPWWYIIIDIVDNEFRIREFRRDGHCNLSEISYRILKQTIYFIDGVLHYETYSKYTDGWDRNQFQFNIVSHNEIESMRRVSGTNTINGDSGWVPVTWIKIDSME